MTTCRRHTNEGSNIATGDGLGRPSCAMVPPSRPALTWTVCDSISFANFFMVRDKYKLSSATGQFLISFPGCL